ncbi:MAG: hypothetical protein IT285_05775 [Bdellovibrionales bacterium]|nr:hypothetical protein [Bdellovibrionales bacterium]
MCFRALTPAFLLVCCAASATNAAWAGGEEATVQGDSAVPPAFPAIEYPAAKPRIRVNHALVSSGEYEELAEHLVPAAHDFIRFWEASGMALPEKLIRIYVQPDPSIPKRQAITRLYGSRFFGDLRRLTREVRHATQVSAVEEAVRKFSCQYPPFYGEAFLRAAEHQPLREWKNRAKRYIEAVLDESRALPGFDPDNGFFSYRSQLDCDFIVLGRTSQPWIQKHPFLDESVVFHEIGHALVYGTWRKSGQISKKMKLPAVHEALADLAAQLYVANPCYSARLNPATGLFSCLRTMNQHSWPLSESLWLPPHRRGDPMRHAVWEAFVRTGSLPGNFAFSFARAVRELAEEARRLPDIPFIGRDAFMNRLYEYRADLELSGKFLGTLCDQLTNRPELCFDLESFLGTLVDNQVLHGLRSASPASFPPTGRPATIVGVDQAVYLGFIWRGSQGGWAARISFGGGGLTDWQCQPAREVFVFPEPGFPPLPQVTMNCSSTDGLKVMQWRSDGTGRMTDALPPALRDAATAPGELWAPGP